MTIELKKDCRYSLIVPTSMGIRITPVNGQPVHSSNLFEMQATSAETNVASIASYLGLPVKVLTNFVKGSPIAQLIKSNLKSRHMDYEGPDVEQGGPWGYRHQFNIADSGYGSRGPRVHNDRAGEVGRTLHVKDFDLDRIFGQEGVQIVHLSGLIAALSPDTSQFCLELARTAKKYGSRISFDLNHRASFWEGREEELRANFTEIASLSDILIGNEEDYQLCLGIQGPEAGGKGIEAQIEGFKGMIQRVKQAFPNTAVFTTTLREVVNVNEHLWGAIMLEGDSNWQVILPRPIRVLDRIGGGDGFVGGLLYGILKEWEPEKWPQFGWATGAMATTFLTDYAQPADEDMVWSIWEGNARVRR
ncbi:PfkB family carbohydrate kinase [Sunxiuqinia elliptica]|uniref:2-dehydro-3-deoxygluconokinase n=1 Tax=Sunxiuqinia elliptica TaxID=655355 RepID=A0A4R6GSM6_9BACT|nr:PfkB family carbohydrate kinase [Sunxiuqinia elliptica]TDN98243.1 2-dehydro-3-deoxygluconokinase [Sunxiuqinia elliptica]TDO60349.1 2-dehydro-3-deoxygluconokinase [Sunxiuqinia elliptica]